ncbi:MarR family transcriptional regulator [Marivivens donghaensis]|uniref:MarR family transcriptional regulator n=1 Tax=Marivivens donghaensis TaxID=1699413 RepID=A0ABX0VY81_9RHOB|nr:MarR family transcriptional regulator [Marivivens donghaensis]NIY71607.1 MarR family transcriptional regulator [Marivivens donghaensis]
MKPLPIILHEAYTLMKRRFEKEARPQNLTMNQWRALGMLKRFGPIRQVELCAALQASPMTISDLADRMETAGLISRTNDPDDSRAKVLELTEAGKTKSELMKAISEGVFEEVFEGVSAEDLAVMERALTRIIQNLGGKL